MKIEVFCNDGSPMGIIPADVYGRGVGGAELALVSWSKTMAARGHEVTVYNDPRLPGDHDGVAYAACRSFNPAAERDVLIAFRSPNRHMRAAKAGLKIHWSTDQYTVGDYSRDVFPFVDKVVAISGFHRVYHMERYGIHSDKIGVIDLGVILEDYQTDSPPERDNKACLFASVPDRGLGELAGVWGDITNAIPDVSLKITSDYTLWGAVAAGTQSYRRRFLGHGNVTYYGSVPRSILVKYQLSSGVLSYPCTYDELFCMTVAEAQVAGCVPVTPPIGALVTTNEFGILTPPVSAPHFKNDFIRAIEVAASYDESDRQRMMTAARERFDWNRICEQWEYLFEHHEFKDVKNG